MGLYFCHWRGVRVLLRLHCEMVVDCLQVNKKVEKWRGARMHSKSDMSDITLLHSRNWSSSVTH